MKQYRPRRPAGTTPFLAFCGAVWDFLWGGKFPFIDTDTVKWRRSESGYAAEARATGGGSGANPAKEIFRVKSVQGDYLTCRKATLSVSGGAVVYTEEDTDTFIAKAPKLRHSITSVTIEGGVTIDYTYSGITGNLDGKRTADDGENTEDQIVLPRWLVNDIIWAVKPIGGADVVKDDELLEWQDLNVDGRAWAKKKTEVP